MKLRKQKIKLSTESMGSDSIETRPFNSKRGHHLTWFVKELVVKSICLMLVALMPILANAEPLRCPGKTDVFGFGNEEGKYIEVCQVEGAVFDFQATSIEDPNGPACGLRGAAKAQGNKFVYSNSGCIVTFTPNSSGMNVVFDIACSKSSCAAGIKWASGEYAGTRSYGIESATDAAVSKIDWNFLRPGTTHSGESPLRPGAGWLALRNSSQGWVLAKTEVRAKKVLSDITDYDIEIKSDYQDAIAMFRLSQLLPGPVITPDSSVGLLDKIFSIDSARGLMFSVDFAGINYQFRAETEKIFPGDTVATRGVLLATSGGKMSFIGYSGQDIDNSEDTAQVIWMGDLDKDNKLDVLTRVSGRNSGGVCLHLSRGATGNQLFAKSICHTGSGC
jgi:hypothetical protein